MKKRLKIERDCFTIYNHKYTLARTMDHKTHSMGMGNPREMWKHRNYVLHKPDALDPAMIETDK